MANEKYLLTRTEIDAMTGVDKIHFLNPEARRLNKSLGDATGLSGLGFHIVPVEPGFAMAEYHVHYNEDECVYVLEGTATATIGTETYAIGPGDFIGYRKQGLPHSILNTGSQTLRCIVVGERNSSDACDYPHLEKRLYRIPGKPWGLVDIDAVKELGPGVGKK